MIVIALPAAAAEAPGSPFVPPGVTPPDYVATVVEKSGYEKDRNWTLVHHGDWSRLRRDSDRDAYTEYLAANGALRIIVSATSIIFLPRFEDDLVQDEKPRNTGERQTSLGENCTVWEIETKKSGRIGLAAITRLSCVTDDGIELWQKQVSLIGTYSQEATHIERRSVSTQDSAPPPRLALDWWDKHAPAPAASEIPDHEVIMALPAQDPRSATSIRTHRRSGQWQRIDETVGARRSIEISHETSQLRFSFSTDKYGRPTGILITRADKPINASAQAATLLPPKALDRHETVLGENCSWLNLTPRMADASTTACLTQDRIALEELFVGRASRIEWTAVSVSRRPVTPDEVKPPAELLDPQTWLVR
jgi:hypothetical protein